MSVDVIGLYTNEYLVEEIIQEDIFDKYLNTEAGAYTNKVIVASELKLTGFKTGGTALPKLIEMYSSGKLTKEKLEAVVTNLVSKLAKTRDSQGNPVKSIDYYMEQGRQLRDEQLKKEKEKVKN